jgi:hypothetical protein
MPALHPRGLLRQLFQIGALLVLLVPASSWATIHVVSGLDPSGTYDLWVDGQLEESGLTTTADGLLTTKSSAEGRFQYLPGGSPQTGEQQPQGSGSSSLNEAPKLMGVFPNPVRENSTLWFDVQEPGDIEVVLYDVRGRRLDTVWKGPLSAGLNQVPMNRRSRGRELPAGTYWVRAETVRGRGEARKVLLLP